jgi:ribosomal protein S14
MMADEDDIGHTSTNDKSLVSYVSRNRAKVMIFGASLLVVLLITSSWRSSNNRSSNRVHITGTGAGAARHFGVCPPRFRLSLDTNNNNNAASSTHHLCVPCTAGYSCDGQDEQIICPIGSYCPLASILPISCGDALTTSKTGAKSERQCRCQFGSYGIITTNQTTSCRGRMTCYQIVLRFNHVRRAAGVDDGC